MSDNYDDSIMGECCMDHLYDYMWDCEHHPHKKTTLYHDWCSRTRDNIPLENYNQVSSNIHKKQLTYTKRKYHLTSPNQIPNVDTSIHTLGELVNMHKRRIKRSTPS